MSEELEFCLEGQFYEPLGLKDGGKHVIECSNCGAPLAEVWVTQPELRYRWKLRAKCCHCGDASFIVKINGGFDLGSTDYTIIGPYEEIESDGYILIETEKLKVWNG